METMAEQVSQKINLQLGDIIQIESPADTTLHNKQFFINYIDTNQIILIDNTNQQFSLTINDDGTLRNESIQTIIILSRSDIAGYARQNNLIPGQWVDIYFDGDIPVVITARITNLDEDQIELHLVETNETIYIDFAYKGIPLDIPIERIVLRDKPDDLEEKVFEEKEEEKVSEKEPGEEKQPEKVFELEEETPEEVEDVLTPSVKQPEKIKEHLTSIFLSADQIQFGTALEAITQVVEVPEEEKRYSIDKQTNDLLDELLSTVPNAQRTQSVLNNIHKMIERFKQLRSEFSKFDNNGNAFMPDIQGADFKPLVNALQNLNTKLYWILPVVNNKRKLYDTDADVSELFSDIVPLTLGNTRIDETRIINAFKKNEIPDGQNGYEYLIKELNPYFTPFERPDNVENNIAIKEVSTNVNAVVSNLEEFYSSVAKNDEVKRKRFLIQTYNLGQNTLETSRIKGSSGVSIKLKQITKPDTIYIKSLLTLPRPAVNFSHISLPSTSIFTKAGLNMNFIPYWRMLTEKTMVNTKIIDNIDKPYEHTEKDFLRGISEYLPDERISDSKKYVEYLKSIIPKTRLLFNLIKDDINGSLSLQSVLQSLEPFMVYQKDLSFKQYEEISKFIYEKIKDYKVKYVANKRELNLLEHGRGFKDLIPYVLEMFKGQGTTYSDIVNDYMLEKLDIKKYSNTELLLLLNSIDNTRLYSVLLALSVKDLMIQDGLEMLTNTEEWIQKYNQISISQDNKECKNYVLTKKYYAMDELEEDNDVDIAFDKQYDKTYYDVIDEYKAELEMFEDNKSKIEYLTEQLKEKTGMSDTDAEREAEALIYKKRFVRDGDYAVLHLKEEDKMFYFKREDNKWVRDETIDDNVFTTDSKMFCNLNEKCIMLKDDCNSVEKTYKDIQKENISKIVDEFDKDLQQNADVMERILTYNKENLSYRIYRLITNIKQELYKNDDVKYKIGLDAKETASEKSPYSKLLSLILSQGDFSKRQNDIAKFVTLYTRPANQDEDIWWLYCITTNTKLLPSFVSKLANVFINKQNYLLALQQISAEQGTLSSDGEAVVDKYSGWVITKIDYSTEEGFTEEGFAAKSREILERDLGDAVIQMSQDKQPVTKYDSPDANKAYRIVNAMSKFMGLETGSIEEFIINESVKLQTKAMPSKEVYDKAVASALAKGRKGLDTYEVAYNQSLIIITLSYFLIAIQTSIPNLRTRKTYPGCIKSFSGYPSFGDEDKTGITYVACVANSIKSSIEPWNAIKQLNEKKIMSKMETTINKTIITQDTVQKKIREKIEYNLLNEEETIPEQHNIKNWINFLPPLQIVKQKTVSGISKEFQEEFIQDIRKGNKKQEDKISALQSKIIYLTLSINNSIQKVVSKNVAENSSILSNNANQPFLENACCNDESLSTITYFTNKEPSIITDNESVKNIRNILDDVILLGKSPILFDPKDTRRPVIQISKEFSEDTIYRAVIDFCGYNTDEPLSTELRSVCLEKPENFDKNDNLEVKIEKLKRAGRVYDNNNLQNLLDVVNSNNIIKVNIKTLVYSNIQQLRDILDLLSEEDNKILPQTFRDRFTSVLDTFAIGGLREDTAEMRSMKNYLSSANNGLINSLIDFVKRNARAGITKKFEKCIKTLNEFLLTGDGIILDKEDETVYKRIHFIKNVIYSIVKVYPQIITNKVNYGDVKIPKHWGLSERHITDIKNIIKKHYSPLFAFYDDDDVVRVFKLFKENTEHILNLAMNTYYFSPVELDGEKVYSILDNSLTSELFKFYILSTLNYFVDLADDLITSTIPQATTVQEVGLTEVILTEVSDQMPQLEMVTGEKKKMSEKIASLMTNIIDIVCSYKETIDYNYDTLMEKLLRAKEKEKTLITDYFKEMTDEEREIEKIQKSFKLERWSVGQQKGFRIYQPDTYDQEREAIENQYLLELKTNKIDGVTDMNREIYSMDVLQELQRESEIEAEEYDISHIGEDNDNYGEEQEPDEY